MGQKDTAVRLYLKDPAIFADACNYALFGGENVIKPESLKEQDISQITALVGREKRDILNNIKAGEADAESAGANKAGAENANDKEADKRKDNTLDRVKRHLNLIVPSEIENFDLFNSNLGLLMQIMEAVKDREKLREVLQTRQTELDELDVNAARVLGLYTGIETGQLEKSRQGGVSMSKYWDAYIEGEIEERLEKRWEKEVDQRMEIEVNQRVEKELDQRVEKELDQRMEEKEKEWESERITLASENSNLTAEIIRLREQLTRLREASM